MITPSPTSKIDARLARGTLLGRIEASGDRPAMIRFGAPNTNYDMYLVEQEPVTTPVGKRVIGTLHAKAKRMDSVETGGRYLEPVHGRPRRVQGRVIAIEGDAVVVSAGLPIHCVPTDSRQKATDFSPGDFISFDVMSGAWFIPEG